MSLSRSLVRAAFLLLCLAVATVHAATVSDLYVAAVNVPDRSDAARRQGFAEALEHVSIRVSGSRNAPGQLNAGDPQRYVQRFGYLQDGRLQVGFDPRAIDELLATAGLPIWGRERPLTLVALQVEDATGVRRVITGTTASPERDAVMSAATLRGLPLEWPSPLDASALASASVERLDEERERLGADALLVGYGTGAGTGLTVRWQFVSGGRTRDTAGAIETGIHLAADTFAQIYAAASGSVSDLRLDVSGIADLDAYAQTLNYLEGLTLTRSVNVTEVSRDVVSFRIVTRGDAETLRRALALDNRLVAEPLDQSAPDPQRLRMRLQR